MTSPIEGKGAFPLKPLAKEAIGAALEKADRYRLLNEPEDAESICRDILAADPENREATIGLLLSLTDQFRNHGSEHADEARALAASLADEYERLYYRGLVFERRAKALYHRGGPQSGHMAYRRLREAMACFERALDGQPERKGAVLRWNTCARMIERHRSVRPIEDDDTDTPALLE